MIKHLKAILFTASIMVIAFMLVLVGKTATAQTVVTTEAIGDELVAPEESCFDYYKFQSVQVSVGPEQKSYRAGESVRFVGELINQNPYPVVDGYVFVRIGEKNPAYINEGQFTVDEFFALGPVSIDASSSMPVSFTWQAPKALKSGDYRADYFFSVGKRFNLGGLPFTNEIVIGFADFDITDGNAGNIVFDRSKTLVDGKKYLHIGNWPYTEKGEQSVVSEILKNTNSRDKKVTVQYDLYWWDSLNPEDKISSRTETVTIKANSSTTISYKLPPADQSVYYLKITATTDDGQKTIDNVRILTAGVPRPRANYPAIMNFPIEEGATSTLFSCYHNASDSSDVEGTLEVVLRDGDNNIVSTANYSGPISGAMSVVTSKFTALKDLSYLTLEERLYNENNELVESYSVVYDCSTLNSQACVEMMSVNWTLVFVLIVLSIFVILIAYVLHMRNPRPHHPHMWSFAVLVALLGVIIVTIAYLTKPVWAEIVSPDGKTKSETVSSNYEVCDTQYNIYLSPTRLWRYAPADSSECNQVYGMMNYSHQLTLDTSSSISDLSVGESFNVVYQGEGTFNAYGGNWDSPYFGESLTSCGAGTLPYACAFWFQVTIDEVSAPEFNVVSDNPGVVDCHSTGQCTAVGPGSATISVDVEPVVTNSYGTIDLEEMYVYSGPLYFIDGITNPLTKTLPGYTTSWNITVTDNPVDPGTTTPPLAPTLSATQGPCDGGINLSWNATATTTGYRIFRNGTLYNTVTSNSYSDNNVVLSTQYSYYVKSYNEAGESAPSNSVSIQSPGTCSGSGLGQYITGSCEVGGSTVIPSPASVSFTATPASGASPFQFSWNGTPYSSNNNLSVYYSSSGSGPSVMIRDSVGSTTQYSVICPSITVQDQPDENISLRIGSTLTNLTSYLSLIRGRSFVLAWNVPASYDPSTECSTTISPSVPTWLSAWNARLGTELDVSGLSTAGENTGTYTFTLSCTNATVGTQSSSVVLRVMSSDIEEI